MNLAARLVLVWRGGGHAPIRNSVAVGVCGPLLVRAGSSSARSSNTSLELPTGNPNSVEPAFKIDYDGKRGDPRTLSCENATAHGVVHRSDHRVLLSHAIRRAGRVALPVVGPVTQLCRRTRLLDFGPEQVRFLNFGVPSAGRVLVWAVAAVNVGRCDRLCAGGAR